LLLSFKKEESSFLKNSSKRLFSVHRRARTRFIHSGNSHFREHRFFGAARRRRHNHKSLTILHRTGFVAPRPKLIWG
jgi:hypothetical protein